MREELDYKYTIPATWEIEVSSEILDIRDGTHDTPKYMEKGGIPLITSKNLKDGIIDFKNVNLISSADHNEISKRSKVKKGDILFAMIGTIGNPVIIKGGEVFSIKNVGLFRRNDAVLLPELLCYFLSSKTFEKQLQERKLLKGTTQKFIPLGSLRNLILPIPPLPEQHRIVAKIEALFSSLDKGIESLNTAKQQLKVYRQAVLKWAFEGKLTNRNVVDGELPEGWKWVKIGDVTEINPKIPNRETISDNLEVQFLPMKLVEEIIGKIHLTEIKKYGEVKKGYTPFVNGDVIFAKVTPCMENGKIAVVENLKNRIGFGSSEFHVIRSGETIIGKYIFHFLVQEKFRKEAENEMTGAVGLRRVPKQFIEKYQIPLPPITEQQLIISEIESRLSVCDKIEESIEYSRKQSEALRQSILKKAFEGKLVPQDPNDEPASVLLDRIRKERAETPATKAKNRSRNGAN